MRRFFWRSQRQFSDGLLSTVPCDADMELAPMPDGAAVPSAMKIEVTRSQWGERGVAIALFLALMVPSLTVAVVVIGEWQNRPTQRSWLLLGFGFYIVAAIRGVWTLFLQVCERMLYVRVELRRFVSTVLFESVTDALAKESERLGLTCSWDQEAVQETDVVTGERTVKFRFWSSQARSLRISVVLGGPSGEGKTLDLQVQFSPGDDIVCGRDSRVERRETLVIFLRTSSGRVLQDKELLQQWLKQCYKAYAKPLEGIVNVYALQESSSDWMPEWKFDRVKRLKSASGTGQSFFLQREALGKVLDDAKLWASSTLRVYMITGPPGVGKSEFVIWLAGQLRLPVYRLSLSSPRLTDDRLAQLLSATAVSHKEFLLQVDEFQEALGRWLHRGSTPGAVSGVTAGGFCECLQGSTSMGCGIVVLSGTTEICQEEARRALPAVFRRVHCVGKLGWMTKADIRRFFRNFLSRFVPGCSDSSWQTWESEFLSDYGPWATLNISLDMLKQYLMRQITESSCRGLGAHVPAETASPDPAAAEEFRIHDEHQAAFFGLMCDRKDAEQFLGDYSPVA